MTLIASFPSSLLTEHDKWHMAHMNEKAPSGGVAFLDFHRKFLAQFHTWYDTSPGANLALVAPWSSIPANVMANLSPSVVGKLATIAGAPAAYPTEDKLGSAIHPLHDNIHAAIAKTFGESGMDHPSSAPEYTEFWNLHWDDRPLVYGLAAGASRKMTDCRG